jgi:peptidoglycan/xylan/chitin deacetylase (PgdA/CDA1 family)
VTAVASLLLFVFLGGPGRVIVEPDAQGQPAAAPSEVAAEAAAEIPAVVLPAPLGQPAPLAQPASVVQPVPLGAARGPAAPLRPISHIVTPEPAVAITFDACATPKQDNGFDQRVFDILKRERVPATIFVSGRWIESHPAAMIELATEPLIEFGDHSYDHPRMSRLSADRIGAEIDRTEAALGQYGKHAVAFRPPFGDWNQRLIGVVHDRRLPTVTWDVVSGDPSTKTTSAAMIREVLRRSRAGSIIIFHINGRGWKTAEALPAILSGLRERGFRFVTLSELMGAGGPP